MIVEIGFIHPSEGIAQLLRHTRLSRSYLTRGIANISLQIGKVIRELLAVLGQAVALMKPRQHGSKIRCVWVRLLASEIVDAAGLRAFLLREPSGFARKRVQFLGGQLLLSAGEEIRRLTQLIGSLPCGARNLRTARALHGVACLLQTFQRLLDSRIAQL